VQVVGVESRCVATTSRPSGEDDLFDLIARDQQELASERARPYLEQIGLIDA